MAATDRKSIKGEAPPFFLPSQRQTLRRRLLAWFVTHQRDLPWRRSRDPYHVWISEIMLQQTQVATVGNYFDRFIHRFPNVCRLAAADETDVLRAWEGLGYYRRARQLHAASKQIVCEYGGRFPDDAAKLQKLPGIGRYTAGAIASIAYGARYPILEANTVRLFSRLIAYRGNPHTQTGQRPLWRFAEELLPQKRMAEFNQALMELGALVCTPSEPKCAKCPLSTLCVAYSRGLQHQIPLRKPRPVYTELREAAVIVRKNGSVLLRRCGEAERWAGLWDFPRFAVESHGPLFAGDELATKVESQTGIACAPGALLKTMRHGVTRYRITLECYNAEYVGGGIRSARNSSVRWLPIVELPTIPLSTTGRRIANLLRAVSEKSGRSTVLRTDQSVPST
jgi:A/G-specific adenine glycosylase